LKATITGRSAAITPSAASPSSRTTRWALSEAPTRTPANRTPLCRSHSTRSMSSGWFRAAGGIALASLFLPNTQQDRCHSAREVGAGRGLDSDPRIGERCPRGIASRCGDGSRRRQRAGR
jgi:hypothetical protein